MPTQLDPDEIAPRLRVKVGRAREHIAVLDGEAQSLLTSTPYMIGGARDTSGTQILFLVPDPIERPRIPAIASDVLQNLRSALDHLAYQLVLVAGAEPSKRTCFPVAEGFGAYERGKGSKVEGMTPVAKALIDEIRPYKGGNDLLWRLHDLNNIDKHRLLRTLPFVIEIGNDKQRIQETLQVLVTSTEPIFAGADKIIRLGDGVQFSTDIAFSEEIVAGQPLLLLDTLREMADMVDEIILEFEPFE